MIAGITLRFTDPGSQCTPTLVHHTDLESMHTCLVFIFPLFS
uniref:Uncharacterized protein n=1 Tax=Arundo donax TaxID=35708 RepID=A0A0A9GQ52_ARUDO